MQQAESDAAISIHAPLARCDQKRGQFILKRTKFQSTHLLRGATSQNLWRKNCCWISIHAPLARCDKITVNKGVFRKIFQSTHLLRGATGNVKEERIQRDISIHAPLARCDQQFQHVVRYGRISIHAPLARCDLQEQLTKSEQELFQSTHLLRGATPPHKIIPSVFSISIHAPLARCDSGTGDDWLGQCISIHAPLARCDQLPEGHSDACNISIHAPLARCDRDPDDVRRIIVEFQSTHLLRGATA